MTKNENGFDFSDEILTLQGIKGLLSVVQKAGDYLNTEEELFAYRELTQHALMKQIEELDDVVKELKSCDHSGLNWDE